MADEHEDNVEEPMLTEVEKERRGQESTAGEETDEEPMLSDDNSDR